MKDIRYNKTSFRRIKSGKRLSRIHLARSLKWGSVKLISIGPAQPTTTPAWTTKLVKETMIPHLKIGVSSKKERQKRSWPYCDLASHPNTHTHTHTNGPAQLIKHKLREILGSTFSFVCKSCLRNARNVD